MAEAFRIDGSKVFYLKDHFARHIVFFRIEIGKLTTDHLGNNIISRHLTRGPGADILPVAHDCDFIADTENLIHLVRNIDDGNTLGFKIFYNTEECFDFVGR